MRTIAAYVNPHLAVETVRKDKLVGHFEAERLHRVVVAVIVRTNLVCNNQRRRLTVVEIGDALHDIFY